jgi:stage II sporulation protein D
VSRCAVVLLLALGAATHDVAAAREIRVGMAVGVTELVVDGSPGLLAAGLPEGRAAETVLQPVDGPLRFGVRPPAAARRAPSTWRVRVRTASSPREARRLQSGLAEAVLAPLHTEPAGDGLAVVAGPFADEASARDLAARLRAAGMTTAQLVEEPGEAVAAPPRLAAVAPGLAVRDFGADRVLLVPAGGTDGIVDVAGTRCRGAVEVSLTAAGTLLAVNVVDIEAYLRGVVPREMGPESFPALEALKAQAVAARSYALDTAGRHAAEGFDVCSGPHCQAYGGASSEHALSDEAVRATAGLVVAHEGRLAHALYSSTCGGHTEAVDNVFAGPAEPYLGGVPCYPDAVSFTRIDGRRVERGWSLFDGRSASDVLARAWALGVLEEKDLRAADLSARARRDETVAWLRRAAGRAGLPLHTAALERVRVDTAAQLVTSVVAAVGWADQAALLAPADLQAARRFSDLAHVSEGDLPGALVALKGGILPPGLPQAWAGGRISRGNVLEILDLWLRGTGSCDPATARFLAVQEGQLLVQRGKERELVPLAAGVALFSARKGDVPEPREALELKQGDRLRLLRGEDGAARYLAVEEDPDGAAFDRMSSYAWWSRRTTVEAMAETARARLGLAGLVDARVTRVSSAGRVIGLELRGASGEVRTVTGFDVRQVLGLPEMRASLLFERGPGGRLVAVRATGRGWGHGVGLCQTGAFGMALQGRDHLAILAHYYPGTQVKPVGDVELPDAAFTR